MDLLRAFTKHFPPPRYITLPAAGVDISDGALKYVVLENDHGGCVVKRWGEANVQTGAVEHGTVKDRGILLSALREVREKAGTEYARLSLPDEHAYLFRMNLARGLSPLEMRQQVEFHLEENVPIAARDAIFNIDVIDEHENEMHVVVTVYGAEHAALYYDLCREAGFLPLSFEVEAQAIVRALVPQGDDGVRLLVDFGNAHTGLGVVSRSTLVMTTTIDIGGAVLDTALAKVFPSVQDAERRKLRNEYGLLRSKDHPEVSEALLGPIASLKDELSERIQYWDTHTDRGGEVREIVLCGGVTNLAGLPEYFTETLGIDTKRGDVWRNITMPAGYVPPITKQASYSYASAIGLALGSC